jgi:hypothetical protein
MNYLPSLNTIQNYANNHFTNFDDDELIDMPNAYGMENQMYTGYNDDMLDFGGMGIGGNLLNEIATNRIYTLTITNTDTAARSFLLTPGYNPANTNIARTGATVSREPNQPANSLILAGDPRPVEFFQAGINRNPVNVVGLQVEGDTLLLGRGSISIVTNDYTKETDDVETINFNHYMNTGDANGGKLIHIKRHFTISYATEIRIKVPESSKVTLTFLLGASLNTHKALRKKNQKAASTKVMTGGGV